MHQNKGNVICNIDFLFSHKGGGLNFVDFLLTYDFITNDKAFDRLGGIANKMYPMKSNCYGLVVPRK